MIIIFSQIIPLDDQTYRILDRLETKGVFVGLPDTKPYTWMDLDECLNRDADIPNADVFDLVALGLISAPNVNTRWSPALRLSGEEASFYLGGALQTSYRYDTVSNLRVGPEISYYGSLGRASFFATHRLTYAANWPDTVFDAKSWRGDERPVFAEIPDALLDVDPFEWLHLEAGRSQMQFGPVPQGGLFLSTQPWGLDHAAYTLKWRKVKFTTMYAWLESQKRMVAHRFEYVASHWKLGLTEGVVARDTNDFFPYIAAPVSFYYFMQWNKLQDDNILWGADASLLFPPFKVYAEFLVDDFAYEPATGPNKIGGTIGAEWVSILSSEIDACADYTAITKWTYAQRDSMQNYTFRGRILGDDLGPDADRARLIFSWRVIPRLSFEVTAFFERYGEGSVWRDFLDDGAHDRETFHPPFPSGIVEGHVGGKAGLRLSLIGRSFISLSGRLESVSNVNHVEDSTAVRPEIQTDLYWEF